MLYFKFGFLFVIFSVVCASKPWIAEKGTTPWATGGAAWWMHKHEGYLNQTRDHPAEIKAVFLGDSITDNWSWIGLNPWNEHYAKRGVVNYGISGDRIEQVLWRVENGEFDNHFKPKVVVLLIGTNNLDALNTVDEIAKGYKALLDLLHQKIPTTPILMLSILPRVHDRDWDKEIGEINKHIISYADNKTFYYFDLSSSFGGANSKNLKTELYMEDKLHLSVKGYEQWYKVMEPTFAKFLLA